MSRNGSGTYILPTGNPVVTGTVIQSSTFNSTLTDVANEMTNSLPRDGQAPMTATLKIVDGTSTIPGLAFNSESASGLFRPSTGNVALTVSGVEALRANSGGRILVGTTTDDGSTRLQVSGNATVSGTLGVGGSLTANLVGGTINNATIGATTQSTGAFTTLSASGVTTLSGNLGIGVAPTVRFDLATGTTNRLKISESTSVLYYDSLTNAGTTWAETTQRATAMNWQTASTGTPTSGMRLDGSGNLGLGATPSSWGGGIHALELANGVSFAAGSSASAFVGCNWYFGSADTYKTTAAASRYQQFAGTHQWHIAPSGTAGNPITFNTAMTLDNSGNLLLGTTTASWNAAGRGLIEINGSTASLIGLKVNGTQGGYLYATGTDLYLTNNQAGNLFLGSSGVTRVTINSAGNLNTVGTITSTGNISTLVSGSLDTNIAANVNSVTNMAIGCNWSGSTNGYGAPTGTNYVASSVAADTVFTTASTVRMRITGAGVIQDAAGNELGYKGLPQNLQSSAYTLVASDRGKQVYMTANGVTVPSGVFNTGDVITIVNGTGSSITITQGTSVTLYQAGTANTGSRTLAVHGICTLLCTNANSFFVSGNVS